jgi:HD-like signal output (HDOD) protein
LISEDLAQRLEANKSLPNPPGVATKIIELANDPEVDIDRIAQVLSIDPAMTARALRIANSPMYAMSREVTDLNQALMLLGLNATISLVLSFSLLKSWQKDSSSSGLDYALFWKRALLAASATRAIAAKLGWRDSEEMFLAALIQDIGVVALDGTLPAAGADRAGDRADWCRPCGDRRLAAGALGVPRADSDGRPGQPRPGIGRCRGPRGAVRARRRVLELDRRALSRAKR